MPEQHERSERWLITITLAFWLGVHALRSYLAMSVWNLADELPLELKSIPPAAVHLLGLLAAWPALRLVGPRRALRWFGFTFCAAYVLRGLFAHADLTASILSFAAWIVWLWWLPALLDAAARAGAKQVIAPAAVLGIALQVAGQTLLHGLDAPLLRGAWGAALAVALGAALVWSNAGLENEREGAAEPIGRGALALIGPWLFLELTLFANVGRIGELSHAGLIGSATVVQLGLALGLVAAAVELPALRIGAALLLVVTVSFAPALSGASALLLVPAHAASVLLLAGACSRGTGIRATRAYLGVFAGGGLLFVLLFGFYTRYEAFGLWPIAAVALALCAFGKGSAAARAYARFGLVIPGVAALAALGAVIPAPRENATERQNLRLLTYNVHQGYDTDGLPAAQRIADVIATADADIVSLQEMGRGWNLLGGADLVAYLEWRFPEKRVMFVPTNGQLWGNAIVTSLPVRAYDGATFSASEAFKYGYAHARLGAAGVALDVYSVHLSADLSTPVEEIRAVQARELVGQTHGAAAVFMGDFNAEPNSPVISTMKGAGLLDSAEPFGLTDVKTWPARNGQQRLDYVFITPELKPANTEMLKTTASDHLPIQVDLQYNRSLLAAHR